MSGSVLKINYKTEQHTVLTHISRHVADVCHHSGVIPEMQKKEQKHETAKMIMFKTLKKKNKKKREVGYQTGSIYVTEKKRASLFWVV